MALERFIGSNCCRRPRSLERTITQFIVVVVVVFLLRRRIIGIGSGDLCGLGLPAPATGVVAGCWSLLAGALLRRALANTQYASALVLGGALIAPRRQQLKRAVAEVVVAQALGVVGLITTGVGKVDLRYALARACRASCSFF
jgi:hypothetical protein